VPQTVQTVTGPVPASELGVTLMHEHVFLDIYEVTLNSVGVLLDRPTAEAELSAFREAGGRTLVDQTTVGLNPDPQALRQVAIASGVHIVAGTGVYWHRFRPSWVETLTESQLRDRFVTELREGIAGSDVRAGIIGEVATGHRTIDPVERRVFRAAAAAHRETGALIATHALFTAIGLEQLDVLEEAGADPRRVLIGHADTNPDLTYHLAVLERGAWLGFDTWGQDDKASDSWRAARVADLAGRGFLDRILISSDVCKRPALRANGGTGYAHVLTQGVPRLVALGFSQSEIDQLLVHNPRQALAGTTIREQPAPAPSRIGD
jgi:phosphotriesterase-related protein